MTLIRTQHRRGRISPAAAVAALLSLAVVVMALWGLTRAAVPAAQDFGPASAPDLRIDRAPEPARSTDRAQRPVSRSGIAIEPPSRRPATLARVETEPEPVRLRLPAVGVDVPLDAVGVADDGQMEIPEDADRAGWYRFGPRPGDPAGSVVVAGHVDDPEGPGAFFRLTGAEEGDVVLVDRADGSTLRYQLVARETSRKGDVDLDSLFDREGDPVLRLVTCTGRWSDQLGHYTDNLVLTASPDEP